MSRPYFVSRLGRKILPLSVIMLSGMRCHQGYARRTDQSWSASRRRTELLRAALLSLSMLAGVLLPSSAPGMEMTFSKDDVGQIWLQLTGRIEHGDDVRFKKMLVEAINQKNQIANVSIYSPGGWVSPAMRIGGYVRTMHLTTVAPQLLPLVGQVCAMQTISGWMTVNYDPRTNRGDPRCTCVGECFLIWAAGVTRVGDAVQIRRMTLEGDDNEGTRATSTTDRRAGTQKAVELYLREMGVPEPTIDRIFSVGSDGREYLTRDQRIMLTENAAPLRKLFKARCHHAAGSPAALACEKQVIRDLYWSGAEQLLDRNE